jgi:hypothetical protein
MSASVAVQSRTEETTKTVTPPALERLTPDLESEMDIARFAAMSPSEINAELHTYNIDPRPTINAISKLVAQKLDRKLA